MNKLHNRKLNRLSGYDYSSNGYYFVTICVKNRIEYFGNIVNQKMVLNKYGEIAYKLWYEIPNHYDCVKIDIFQIMPNHIHGIIIIDDIIDSIIPVFPVPVFPVPVGTEHCSVPTGTNTKTGTENIKSNYGLLSKIVKSYKDVFIKIIHKQYNNYEFQWQRSFYDHIIRNENALRRIREYIRMNPIKWEFDRNNKNIV